MTSAPTRTLLLPPTYQDSAEAGHLVLRDGSAALVRVSQPSDVDALREFFNRLSPQSRRRRFFSTAEPAEALLAKQCDSSNPRSQLTLIVSRIVDGPSRIIAEGSYVARDETTAEVAFAVDDEFQGKGLGGLLLERLALLAARQGFARFWAMTMIENRLMLETFRRSGFSPNSKVEDDYVEFDFSVLPSEDSVGHSELRERVFTSASLHPFFRPRSIAVVGASRDRASIGHRCLAALVRGGFHGPVYPVNKSATHVHSIPVYPSARQIPQGTDLALLAIPREAVLDVVDDCAAAGVRALVVVSAGFAETDAEGCALQEKLLARVRGHGMRMVGPNSMGLLNTDPEILLNASLSPTLPPRGGVAMSSQSGALGLAMLALARQRHVGISTFISVGNRADISGNDLLRYWQDDPSTRVILLYLESFGNPRRFARVARAVSATKPIVVVKTGRRTAGPKTADDPAAAPVPGEAVVDALFRQTGVIRAETLDEMFDLAAALDRQPLPSGLRVAILSDGGGPGLLCAGACEAARLEVPPLSESTRENLAAFLPPAMTLGNPLELAPFLCPELYGRAVATLLSADEVDALIAIHTPLDASGSAALLEAMRQGTASGRATGGKGKPVLACLVAKEDAGIPLLLEGESIPTYAFPESAARVLGKVAAYSVWRARPRGVIPDFVDIDPGAARRACRRAIEERGDGFLPPEEAWTVLRAMHLPVVPGGVAINAEEAVALAQGFGFPVALRLASNLVLHRTEKGAAYLDLEDEAAVRGAFDAIREFASSENSPGGTEGVVVRPMIGGGVEITVRMFEDPSFGPLIALGFGGTHVEVITDVSVRVTPLTDRTAAAMIREVRGYPLLEGYRGHPPADVDAIKDVLLRVSRLVEEVPDIAGLELGPIFVGPPGAGCRIADTRVRVARPQKGQAARYAMTSSTAPRETAAAAGSESGPPEGSST